MLLIAAGVIWAYLTEYGLIRKAFAASICFLGVGAAVIIYLLVSKYCKSRKRAIVFISVLAVLLFTPLISMSYPGAITYSRFGLTIYGLIPIPFLDITVGPHGGLWFRDKSHFLSVDEARALLSPEVDVLVIGTGWQSQVKVDPAIKDIERIEVYILPTPKAFDLFNKYKSEGKTVVLAAHSTC